MARIKVAFLRELEALVTEGAISYSKMVELLNEKAQELEPAKDLTREELIIKLYGSLEGYIGAKEFKKDLVLEKVEDGMWKGYYQNEIGDIFRVHEIKFGFTRDSIGKLQEEMDIIFNFLKDKNEKYGSSITEPLGIFHKGTTIEAINARIDDKLARIKNQSTDEDAELDLIGYLLWKRVLNKNK